ncbi:Liprin-alpha [Trichuris trichiura]|uniref:Liprin-alpha n=1 Tax=Trichuris trichiura TaxID=36087 RepID=A0A077Z483_TRITR|nr:Liprin-alpha [Trichuris trichiura]
MWNLMRCDVMPTISEDSLDGACSTVRHAHNLSFQGLTPNNETSKFEQIMVNMLDERDKLYEQLLECRRQLEEVQSRLSEAQKTNELLQRQLEDSSEPISRDVHVMAKELAKIKEQLLEKEEEILLLEHLECLVSRHERSLRMTVVKRQTQASGDMSSEAEVLKALKSLFEHHKALDEKVRERLRVAMGKVSSLENELATAAQENASLNQRISDLSTELEREKERGSGSPFRKTAIDNSVAVAGTEASNSELVGLQNAYDETKNNLSSALQRLNESVNRISKLEESLNCTHDELSRAQELNRKLNQDLQESIIFKSDQEERLNSLEGRCLTVQRESSLIQEQNDKLMQELTSKDAALRLNEEKVRNLQERLELAEQQLAQSLKRSNSTPSVEAELQQRMEALSAFEQKHLSAEERIGRLERQIEEKNAEVLRVLQREKMNEDHNQRLSSTVDKLLSESNERLQQHLKERMQALEDKNRLLQELEDVKKALMHMQRLKNRLEREKEFFVGEIDSLRNQLYSCRTAQFQESLQSENRGSALPADYLVARRPCKGRERALRSDVSKVVLFCRGFFLSHLQVGFLQVQTLNEHDWDRLQQAHVLANIHYAFSKSPEEFAADSPLSEGTTDAENGAVVADGPEAQRPQDTTSGDDSNALEAETLAAILQEQLDVISSEIKFIQEEKQGAESREEQLEDRCRIYSSQFHSLPNQHSCMVPQAEPATGSVEDSKSKKAEYFPRHGDGYLPHPRMVHGGAQFICQDYDARAVDYEISNDVMCNRKPLARDISEIVDHGHESPHSSPSSNGPNSFETVNDRGASTTANMKRSSSSGLRSLGRFFARKDKLKSASPVPQRSANFECSSSAEWNLGDYGTLGKGVVDFDHRKKKKYELLDEAIKAHTPFAKWNGPTIVAWLELWVGMPSWYVAACHANVKSGAIMSALSDQEIQREIGISNPLHRLKLRLAIQEMVSLTSPSLPKTAHYNLAFGELNHEWIGNEWLPSLGLPQYRSAFMECLVDARMLEHLTKKDLRVHLKMLDSFHRYECSFIFTPYRGRDEPKQKTIIQNITYAVVYIGTTKSFKRTVVSTIATDLRIVIFFYRASLQYGIFCLKKLNYDRKLLEERREASEDCNRGTKVYHFPSLNVFAWSNERIMRWIDSINLGAYSGNLRESGVHGALISCDDTFDWNALALLLQIPNSDNLSRQILQHEFQNLLMVGTSRMSKSSAGIISTNQTSSPSQKIKH